MGILDSGIPLVGGSLSHPDLNDPNKIILGPDYIDDGNGVKDEYGHGTHVAGIVSAESNNGTGVAGGCWNCKLRIIQVFDDSGSGTWNAFKNGVINAVDNGCQVINFSGGGASPSSTAKEAVQYAYDHNCILVASAGNDNSAVCYPAAYSSEFSNVLAVAATDYNDNKASYSNYGLEIRVAAPGGAHDGGYPVDAGDIYSTTPNYHVTLNGYPYYVTQNYGYLLGTSMAAPYVSGLAALVLSLNSYLSAEEVRNIIEQGADDKGATGWDQYYGWGRINAHKSLQKSIILVTSPNGGECFINDSDVKITWKLTDKYTITSQTIYYSTNRGNTWIKIADLGGAERSYYWHIPRSQTSSSNCRVKVEAVDNQSNTYWDMSDSNFEIWQFEPYLSGMLCANGEVLADLHWSWDPGPYYLDHYELWRNKVVIYTGTGTSYTDPLPFNPGDSRQYRVDAFYRKTPGGSLFIKSSNVITLSRPGGCPYVFSWNGTEFSEDNNILAGSGDGESVSDFYKLRQSLIEENGEYRLELKEFENEHSFIDMVKLIAIDHAADIDIEAIGDDVILPYRDVIAPLYCVDQTGEEWTGLVANPGEGYFEGYEGDTLTMNFGEIGAGSYVFLPMASPKSGSVDVATYDSKTGWQTIQSIYPREYSSVSPVVINHLFNDSLRIRLIWHSYHRLEYAGLGRIRKADYHIKPCPLVSATHSNTGSVKQKLLIDDEDYAELIPGDSITLEFAVVDIEPEWVRDFVFVSNGYYTTEGGRGGAQTAYSSIPMVHSLSLYPNPARNEMTIRFGIPREEKVSLKVYDVSGREIKALVDGRVEAGYHVIKLDGKNLPSGIYFARLITDGYKATKKLVLMK